MADSHLIDIESLPTPVLRALIARARALAEGDRPRPIDRPVANLFLEPSTRTRVSFELAARRLGMDVINLEPAHSSTCKGESLYDTAATLAAMGVAALVLRLTDSTELDRLHRAMPTGICLLNAGDGTRAHPSQALLDAATLEQAGIDWRGAAVALIGDIRHSRVANSDIALFRRLGVGEIRIAGPEPYLPAPDPSPWIRRCPDLGSAIDQATVIVCLRVQRERIEADRLPDPEQFHRKWGLTVDALERYAPNAWVLHPGPVNRGVEMSADLVEHPRSLISAQVRMGVFMRMAIFEHWLTP